MPVFPAAGTQHQLAARLLGAEFDIQGQGGVEGIGHIRDDQPQQVGSAGTEAPGQEIGTVARLPADPQDPFPRFAVYLRGVVQGAGDRGDGDAGKAGDIFDRDTLHMGSSFSGRKTGFFGNVCKWIPFPGGGGGLRQKPEAIRNNYPNKV